MTNLQRYDAAAQPAPYADRPVAPTALDEWVLVVRDVSRLAAQIADTPFVPDGMRGNPAAVTAAILTGREMNLGPMTSLQHIHVIKGKPGKSAEIVRAMILAAGHEIREIEVSDSRVVLEGRRRDEEQWTRVMFTADQARRARIDLGGYPEDKLYARATTRLARRKFADVIGGIAAVIDELEDSDDDGAPAAAPAPAADSRPRRTAKRKTPPARSSAPTAPADSDSDNEGDGVELPAPPLPGEAGFDAPAGDEAADDDPAATAADDDPAAPGGRALADPTAPATRAQLTRLHATLGEFGLDDRADKLRAAVALVGRPLSSSSDLTRVEAANLIDTLARLQGTDDPRRTLDLVLSNADGDGDVVDAEVVDEADGAAR